MAEDDEGAKFDPPPRQQLIQELQDSETKYRALFENSRDALMLLTRDKFIDCNQQTVELFGFKNREEFLEHSPWELSPPHQPDGNESLQSAKRRIENAFEEGEEHFEWKHRRADGTEFWADVKLSRVNLENKQLLLALIRDITAQKERENQLEAVNQQLQAQNQQLNAFNQQLQATEQQLRAEIDHRQKIEDKLSEINNCFISLGEKPYENIEKLVETAKQVLEVDVAAYNRLDIKNNQFNNLFVRGLPEDIELDGDIENYPCCRVIELDNFCEVYISDLTRTKFYSTDPHLKEEGLTTYLGIPVRLDEKATGAFCVLTKDKRNFSDDEIKIMKMLGRAVCREEKRLADRKELSRYVDLKNDLETALEEKETLLKEVHHRVKNNMQQIVSILALQQLEIDDDQIVTILQKSQERVQAMGLIHNLLYKSGNLTEIKLDDYLEKLIHQLIDAYLLNKNNIEVDLKFPESIHLDVDNALACGLVVNELIANALYHGLDNGQEPGKLSVELKPTGEDEINLTIADTGPGFPSKQEFKNPDSLGLQLVRGITTRELQGEIDLEQNDQTEIKITFPR